MRRGEVYLADLVPRSGSEQGGRRPVLVLSHDSFNLTPGWRSVTVVPFSASRRRARRGVTAVVVARGDGGLPRESVAICHQITTLDRGKLRKRLGTLAAESLAAIEFGVRAGLDLR